MPSTLKLLKKSQQKPAKAVVSSIASKQGGLLCLRCAGELPRNQKQVYNARQQESKPDQNQFHFSSRES